MASARLLTVFIIIFLAAGAVTARVARGRCPARTTLATFNGAFNPFYPGVNGNPEVEERVALLVEQIENSNVDILCLQEVFFADTQRLIYRALKNKYPYAVSALNLSLDEESPQRACTVQEAILFQTCIATQCPGLTGNLLGNCFLMRCKDVIDTVSTACIDCISLYGPTSQQAACVTLPASRFETSYGLLLLSNKELKNGQAFGFNPQSQIRGYLQASVDGVGDLICTHLTALTSTEIYIGPPVLSTLLYSNYDQQQYDEITTLFGVMANMETPILMGDFNHGPPPVGENPTWELPFHYGILSARGFVSPYVLHDGRCTFCVDNPSVAEGFSVNFLVDHIYLTTEAYNGRVITSQRFLDNAKTATGTTLSDHYGVSVTLKDIRSNCRFFERWLYYCPSQRLLAGQLPIPQAELERLCRAPVVTR